MKTSNALNKNHGISRNSCDFWKRMNSLRGLAERPNALGAQYHLNLAPILEHRNPLQVGAEHPVGCSHREAAVVSKSCCLSTHVTFRHRQKFLSKRYFINRAKIVPGAARLNSTTTRNFLQA